MEKIWSTRGDGTRIVGVALIDSTEKSMKFRLQPSWRLYTIQVSGHVMQTPYVMAMHRSSPLHHVLSIPDAPCSISCFRMRAELMPLHTVSFLFLFFFDSSIDSRRILSRVYHQPACTSLVFQNEICGIKKPWLIDRFVFVISFGFFLLSSAIEFYEWGSIFTQHKLS